MLLLQRKQILLHQMSPKGARAWVTTDPAKRPGRFEDNI